MMNFSPFSYAKILKSNINQQLLKNIFIKKYIENIAFIFHLHNRKFKLYDIIIHIIQ